MSQISEAEVQDCLARRLIRYKALDGGVQFAKSIPRGPSGKILKRLFRDLILQHGIHAKLDELEHCKRLIVSHGTCET